MLCSIVYSIEWAKKIKGHPHLAPKNRPKGAQIGPKWRSMAPDGFSLIFSLIRESKRKINKIGPFHYELCLFYDFFGLDTLVGVLVRITNFRYNLLKAHVFVIPYSHSKKVDLILIKKLQ